MGKKLDALFGRRRRQSNGSKLKALLNLAVSRLAVLKNQRHARCSVALSDIVQLLSLGHHDRAVLRVEQVIKEQNMLDVFVMTEGYCHLLVERINLIEQEKVCPEELKEAVSSLLYASTRCGEFPELQEMRAIFTSRFGKDFAASAIELRNNCGVNPKMIQKLSTRQPSLEIRMKVLKEIASENNIVLQIEEASSLTTEEKYKVEQKQNQPESTTTSGASKLGDNMGNLHDEIENMEGLSDSMKGTGKYKDVAEAAEAAFKSAAYAAAAARAAVELSRSESHDPDDQNSPGPDQRKLTRKNNSMKSEIVTTEGDHLSRIEDQNVALGLERIHPFQNCDSESEDEIHGEKKDEESKQGKIAADSGDYILEGNRMPLDVMGKTRPMEGIVFDESDDEPSNERGEVPLSRTYGFGFDTKPSLFMTEGLDSGKFYTSQDEDLSEKDSAMLSRSHKKFPLRSQGAQKEPALGNIKAHSAEGWTQSAHRLSGENRPVSVRTRRAQGR